VPAVPGAQEAPDILTGPDRATHDERPRVLHVGERPRTEHCGEHEAVVRVEVREQDERQVMHGRAGAAHQGGHRRAAVDQDATVHEIRGVTAAGAERTPAAEHGETHGHKVSRRRAVVLTLHAT
jgi:hypothetical protein